jgi:hypothetical protein
MSSNSSILSKSSRAKSAVCCVLIPFNLLRYLWFIFLASSIICSRRVLCEDIDVGESSPQVPPTTTRGMIIDAGQQMFMSSKSTLIRLMNDLYHQTIGSGGSRLHVYRWSPRIFDTVPPPLSYPLSDEKWTGRIAPAIQTYVNNLDKIVEHITPLIDFAKSVLSGLEGEYKNYPIFFKATGKLC